jgi:hypothetical protein
MNPDPIHCYKKCCGFEFIETGSGSSIGIESGSASKVHLSLGILKGRPSYRRNLQPSKEIIQHFRNVGINFFLFFWHFCPPGSGAVLRMYSANIYLTYLLLAVSADNIEDRVKGERAVILQRLVHGEAQLRLQHNVNHVNIRIRYR